MIDEYSAFSRSFSKIVAPDLSRKVEEEYERGCYWPLPLIQINPNYKRSGMVQKLVRGKLHVACASLFQTGNRVFPALLKRLSEASIPSRTLVPEPRLVLARGETQDRPDDAAFRC